MKIFYLLILFFFNFGFCQLSENKLIQHKNMVFIKEGSFEMGADNSQANIDEYPKHRVILDGFWMDITEVTNAQFEEFVKETNYITTAERNIDWEELKMQLPPQTIKPSEEALKPSSLVFDSKNPDYWWKMEVGACWRHPSGLKSNIINKEDYPVVQVSWDDAMAYCKWVNKRLPTEAEWEYAARGGLVNEIYPWGNESIENGAIKANTWQGEFPSNNTNVDKFINTSPVKSFMPNNYGLYDMAGNVWEWCSDFYDFNYYISIESSLKNPKGPSKSFDSDDIYTQKRVIRGGSFLCSDGYCSGYRNARRMKETPDTSMEHIGFRCVSDE